jgi:HTH-type transcriptional regulator, cell division transcriptional repressor
MQIASAFLCSRQPESGIFVQIFSERLRARRHALNLSQEDLAELAGVAPRSVVQWEAGAMPTSRMISKLGDALGVSPSWLMGGSHADEAARLTMRGGTERTDDWGQPLLARLQNLPDDERARVLSAFHLSLDMFLRNPAQPPMVPVPEKLVERPSKRASSGGGISEEAKRRLALAGVLAAGLDPNASHRSSSGSAAQTADTSPGGPPVRQGSSRVSVAPRPAPVSPGNPKTVA